MEVGPTNIVFNNRGLKQYEVYRKKTTQYYYFHSEIYIYIYICWS